MTNTAITIDTPIHAVLFDYGMVLSGPPNMAAWERMKTISLLDEESLHREYWKHRHAYDRGTHTGEAYWRHVGEGNGRVFSPQQIADLIDADTDLWTDLNPPMLDWARHLQAAGIRTGILSNLGDAMTAGVLRKCDWVAEFHHCTWSHALKLAKPEQAIYRHAADSLATPPENILFIDDRVDNIEAARSFGMQTLQYGDHSTFIQEMQARGLATLLYPGKPSTHEADALRM